MGQLSPIVRRRRLGLELRQLREEKGLTGEQAAQLLHWSSTKLGRIELGRTPPRPADVDRLLDIYEITDEAKRNELTTLHREARRKGWWQIYSDIPYTTYIGLEAEAATMYAYETAVPGLFQTEAYAHAIIDSPGPLRTAGEVDELVEVRMTRQGLLTKEQPLEIRSVIDEAALRRMIGGQATMRGQVERLLELTEYPNVIMQVFPFTAGAHQGVWVGSFVILEFAHPLDPSVLYLEMSTDPYPDRPGDLQKYTTLFDHIRGSALGVSNTKSYLSALLKEL